MTGKLSGGFSSFILHSKLGRKLLPFRYRGELLPICIPYAKILRYLPSSFQCSSQHVSSLCLTYLVGLEIRCMLDFTAKLAVAEVHVDVWRWAWRSSTSRAIAVSHSLPQLHPSVY